MTVQMDRQERPDNQGKPERHDKQEQFILESDKSTLKNINDQILFIADHFNAPTQA